MNRSYLVKCGKLCSRKLPNGGIILSGMDFENCLMLIWVASADEFSANTVADDTSDTEEAGKPEAIGDV